MGTDWQLGLFRFGIAACVALLVFVVTQFDIANSISAIWNHNRTAQEIAAVDLAAETRQNACVTEAKKKPMEYPSDCYSGGLPQREQPRDVAVANLEGFIASSLALLGAVVLVIFLGRRMARNRPASGL
jgi:hypothetical protein